VPFDAIGLGLMVSLFSSAVVRDPSHAQQRVTLLIIPLPAVGAWTAAAFLNRWPWTADIGFVVVVFSASLARLEGPRGMALGMVAYISYFISDVTDRNRRIIGDHAGRRARDHRRLSQPVPSDAA
jgi:hypothetical protein